MYVKGVLGYIVELIKVKCCFKNSLDSYLKVAKIKGELITIKAIGNGNVQGYVRG